MSAPPHAAPLPEAAVSRQTESHPSRRRIRASIAQVLEANGQPVVGARLQRLVTAYTCDGPRNIDEIPAWLTRRGDLLEARGRLLAHDTRQDWRVRS